MDGLGLDAVVFPALADVGPADADVNPRSAELAWRNGTWDGTRADLPAASATESRVLADGELRLASWRQMIDDGSMLDGDDYLKATGLRLGLLCNFGPRAQFRRRVN